MKKILILGIFLVSMYSCKKKTCPAYMSNEELQKKNDKELRKSLKKRKHKKARMY